MQVTCARIGTRAYVRRFDSILHSPWSASASGMVTGYFEFNSRTNLAYSSVAFFSSSPMWSTSRASAFLSASTALCTLFSAALTSSMVDMGDPQFGPIMLSLPTECLSILQGRHDRRCWIACTERPNARLSLRSVGRSFAVIFASSTGVQRFPLRRLLF